MRSVLGGLALAVPLALVLACASKAPPSTSARDPNLLTYEDFERHQFTDLYVAIEALRSNWLVTRGADSFRTPSEVVVRYDDTRLGDVSTLHTINIKSVVYVRYYSGVEATGRWGLDHGAGVIFVSSRNTPKGEVARPPDTTSTSPR